MKKKQWIIFDLQKTHKFKKKQRKKNKKIKIKQKNNLILVLINKRNNLMLILKESTYEIPIINQIN